MKISKATRAIVTGAGGGLGREFCLQLAARGARVWVTDIDLELAKATAREALARGATEALPFACDVSKKEQVAALAAQAGNLWGAVDLLINNAGVGVGGEFSVQDLPNWEWIMGINLMGVVHGCHYFHPLLKKSGNGALLNVASVAGIACGPYMVSYNVTKAGVIALTETLAAERRLSGVSATVVCPAFFRTGLLEHTRLLDPKLHGLLSGFFEHTFSTAESVARASLRGVERGKLYVFPSWDARLLWWIKRFVPRLMNRVSGRLISH